MNFDRAMGGGERKDEKKLRVPALFGFRTALDLGVPESKREKSGRLAMTSLNHYQLLLAKYLHKINS